MPEASNHYMQEVRTFWNWLPPFRVQSAVNSRALAVQGYVVGCHAATTYMSSAVVLPEAYNLASSDPDTLTLRHVRERSAHSIQVQVWLE